MNDPYSAWLIFRLSGGRKIARGKIVGVDGLRDAGCLVRRRHSDPRNIRSGRIGDEPEAQPELQTESHGAGSYFLLLCSNPSA
jgi:hypothetical protein